MTNRPTRRVDRRDVRPGDVVRWGSGGRWALVAEAYACPNGLEWRLMWVFGAAAGHWVHNDPGVIPGWVDPRFNTHSLATALTVIAKDKDDAATDAARLGWAPETGQIEATPQAHASAILRALADGIEQGSVVDWALREHS